MTAEEFWKSWLAFWLLAGPGLLGMVSIAYNQYLSFRYLDAIKEALQNSRYIYILGATLGNRGLVWSLLEIAKITQMIMMPRSSLKIGELDPCDLENFPPHLKRLLRINVGLMLVGSVWLGVVVVLLRLK